MGKKNKSRKRQNSNTPSVHVKSNGEREVPKAHRSAATAEVLKLRHQIRKLESKYDAAGDGQGWYKHWKLADNLSPDAANSLSIRKKLRERARYEVIENNPYLKGTLITLANDFVGTGPNLKITDPRISETRRSYIENLYLHHRRDRRVKYRQILWQARMATIFSGEHFHKAYYNPLIKDPIKTGFEVFECDRCTTDTPMEWDKDNEVDGIKFDKYGNPSKYFVLDQHPGTQLLQNFTPDSGNWIDEKWVTHWFRRDRPWQRGIPEITPSLPLCALLRRYTLAVVLAAEAAADMAVLLETDGPPSLGQLSPNSSGNFDGDDEDYFDTIPLTKGMMTTLPGGYKAKQMRPEHPSMVHDRFVDILLREIVRPLCTPFNIASGSSMDANMSSAVVDTHIYKTSQGASRLFCGEDILDKDLELWWEEALLLDPSTGYLSNGITEDTNFLLENPTLNTSPPLHEWGWDQIGLEHTDPLKVAMSLKTLREGKILTDRDIQEGRFNRRYEDWQEEVEKEYEFRQQFVEEEETQNQNSNTDEGDDD